MFKSVIITSVVIPHLIKPCRQFEIVSVITTENVLSIALGCYISMHNIPMHIYTIQNITDSTYMYT